MLKDRFHQAWFWVLLIVGSGLFLAGLLVLIQDYRYTHKATRVEGTILSATLGADPGKGYRWDLKVSFWTKDRVLVEALVQSSGSTGYQEGKTLPLLYDPKDPQQVRVDNSWDLWGASALSLGVGGAVLWYLLL